MARLNLLEETRYEKLPVTVYADQHTASLAVAAVLPRLSARNKQPANQRFWAWQQVLHLYKFTPN
jgi:glucosamine-6-phosphate deaminase